MVDGDGGKKAPRKRRDAEPSAHAHEMAPTVSERVAQIRRLMVARQWDDEHAATLAEVWGVSSVTVRAHAAEAARQIEAMLDQEQVRAFVDGLLLEAADRARQEEKHADAARALCAVVKEGRELAGLTRKNAAPLPGKPAPAQLPDAPPTKPELKALPPWKKHA